MSKSVSLSRLLCFALAFVAFVPVCFGPGATRVLAAPVPTQALAAAAAPTDVRTRIHEAVDRPEIAGELSRLGVSPDEAHRRIDALSDAELASLPARLAPLIRTQRPARVDSRVPADVWFEPSLVLEVLSAELTLSPNHTAGWGELKDNAGLAMRFPRFTGRWRDDKEPQDATTTQQLVELYRTARRAPASS